MSWSWAQMLLVAWLMTPALVGCSRDTATARPLPGGTDTPPGPGASIESGRKIYNFRCYFCHGYSGDAKTLAATYLQPPPRDFTRAPELTQQSILDAVRQGRRGTAMMPFGGILTDAEIQAVAAFVERELVRGRAHNTAYHTSENGWPDHHRFVAAYPFVTDARQLDAADETLDAKQRYGRNLFLSVCVSCHDRAYASDEGLVWSARPLSYPRAGFGPTQVIAPVVDAVSSASVYAKHNLAPRLAGLSRKEQLGQRLFQANCAFCHAADGTGKNWIGQFMEPKARDLTALTPQTLPQARLSQTIRDGLPGTSMPAWRGVLTVNEIDAISAYVGRAFLGRRPGAGNGGDPSRAHTLDAHHLSGPR
jgi:cytochrome c oxidase cbb3-type subunit III